MPTGSRRTIEVWPSRYSVTARPSGTRQAPAKNRNRSELVVISSMAAGIGLPVWLDSRRPSSSAFSSRMSAILSSARLRVWGVVRPQRLEGGLRRVDRAVHVRLARGRDVRDDSAVGRVLDRDRLAGGRVDPLPPDELLVRLDSIERLGHGRPPGQRARALAARGVGCVGRLCATPRGRSSGDRPVRRSGYGAPRPSVGLRRPVREPDTGGRGPDGADDGHRQLTG